ncbi:hypothetical protein VA249_09710 [Vibrio alfacsensis]|uniref:hypothetical protein n=1 Tax=Vibrio alfacsensis TaxID=1074311 RepID=UPI001BEEDBEE|nr:hypothetical protein [Vibrio alfacsensis]BBM64325.1 hypothetical protein VA249_09710 [Vibrio alfacsensis]
MSEQVDIQKEIYNLIDSLTSVHGFSTTEVVSEMLFISCELVKSNKAEVQDLEMDENFIFDDDDDESEIAYAKDDLSDFHSELKKLARGVEKGKVDHYALFSLVDRVECFLDDFEDETIKAIKDDYDSFCVEFEPLKKKAEAISAKEKLVEINKRIIHSISSIKSILGEVEKFEIMLDNGDVDSLKLALEIKKKCAFFRANKKKLDADFAKEIGNINKYTKLIAEAQALLKQDWYQMVGNEDFPLL